jgi:HTH-type transcriptional repressor of NAD biosynthesis genes
MTKKYEAGMYGGKFLPMHKGHIHCLRTASEMCDLVYLIMFYGGAGERQMRETDKREMLTLPERFAQVKRAAAMFDNGIPVVIERMVEHFRKPMRKVQTNHLHR